MAAPLPAAPAAARTQFTFVAGATATGRVPSFDCDDDSPMITSLTFLPWVIGPPGTQARVSRSSMVGTLIKATRRTTCPIAARCCREFQHPDGTRTLTYLVKYGDLHYPIKHSSLLQCLTAEERARLPVQRA